MLVLLVLEDVRRVGTQLAGHAIPVYSGAGGERGGRVERARTKGASRGGGAAVEMAVGDGGMWAIAVIGKDVGRGVGIAACACARACTCAVRGDGR